MATSPLRTSTHDVSAAAVGLSAGALQMSVTKVFVLGEDFEIKAPRKPA
jgi:hypothetical protein